MPYQYSGQESESFKQAMKDPAFAANMEQVQARQISAGQVLPNGQQNPAYSTPAGTSAPRVGDAGGGAIIGNGAPAPNVYDGVDTSYGTTTRGGIEGILGGKDLSERFAPRIQNDAGYDQRRSMLMQYLGRGDFTPQQIGPAFADSGQQMQIRDQQMMLAQALQRQAAGQGPSLAQMQLQQGTDRNMQQALAMAASQRGMNPAVAAQQAMNARAQAGQQGAMQSAMLRQQEMLDAQNQLGGLYGQMRGADIGVSQFNAGQSQQAMLANQQAGMQARQIGSQEQLQGMAMLAAADQQQLQNNVGQSQFMADLLARQRAAEMGVSVQSAAQGMQALGAVAQGAGSAIGSVVDMFKK